jgi:ADP-heptose:LPS heptosyltransferase
MTRILIIRFSAIGDVAMTIPVIYSFANQYPQVDITVLSRRVLQPLFQEMPPNVHYYAADLKGKHKGIRGVYRLYKELKAEHFDMIADFHNVIRTKLLCTLFRFAKVRVESVSKGRMGKQKLTRRRNKILKNQKSSFRRFADVLEKLGYPILLNFASIYGNKKGDFSKIASIIPNKGSDIWIGIAPFAKHEGKIYPLKLQEKVVAHFASTNHVKVFLFGGGKEEANVFDNWLKKYPTVISTVGKLNMSTELILMSYLDVMLSMDSANMHMASLVDIPVISIWGATHPYAGFMGWKQLPVNTIQLDMPCRPCSVYGESPCYRGDYACMNNIDPERVIKKIEGIIY